MEILFLRKKTNYIFKSVLNNIIALKREVRCSGLLRIE